MIGIATFFTCIGPIQASSASLTHAAIYQANPDINAVIHVHDRDLWENLLDRVPTTARNCDRIIQITF